VTAQRAGKAGVGIDGGGIGVNVGAGVGVEVGVPVGGRVGVGPEDGVDADRSSPLSPCSEFPGGRFVHIAWLIQIKLWMIIMNPMRASALPNQRMDIVSASTKERWRRWTEPYIDVEEMEVPWICPRRNISSASFCASPASTPASCSSSHPMIAGFNRAT